MLDIKQIVDEVYLRAQRHNLSLELDPQTVATFANRARREVQLSMLALYPERSGRIAVLDIAPPTTQEVTVLKRSNLARNIDVTVWRHPLPEDCIDVSVAVMHFQIDGVTYNREMRRLDRRELHTIQGHAWNAATVTAPVFGIDREVDESTHHVYFAGVDTTTTLVTSGSLVTDHADTNLQIEVWYTSAIDFLELAPGDVPTTTPDLDWRTPWIAVELVIINTLVDCYQKLDAPDALESVRAEQQFLASLIEDVHETQVFKKSAGLPSREPLWQ